MSTVTEAAEQCKTLLMEMREACIRRELKEREAEVEREQRSIAKSARLDNLFKDLEHIEEGMEDIRENGTSDGNTAVSHGDIAEITRIVEENHQAQVAQLIAVMEGGRPSVAKPWKENINENNHNLDSSINHRRQQSELLAARQGSKSGRPMH